MRCTKKAWRRGGPWLCCVSNAHSAPRHAPESAGPSPCFSSRPLPSPSALPLLPPRLTPALRIGLVIVVEHLQKGHHEGGGVVAAQLERKGAAGDLQWQSENARRQWGGCGWGCWHGRAPQWDHPVGGRLLVQLVLVTCAAPGVAAKGCSQALVASRRHPPRTANASPSPALCVCGCTPCSPPLCLHAPTHQR